MSTGAAPYGGKKDRVAACTVLARKAQLAPLSRGLYGFHNYTVPALQCTVINSVDFSLFLFSLLLLVRICVNIGRFLFL